MYPVGPTLSGVRNADIPADWYAPGCHRCERLAAHLRSVRTAYPGYHAGPVVPFGDPTAGLLVVGLAPGMLGANATGRPFTGGHAGILLDSYHCSRYNTQTWRLTEAMFRAVIARARELIGQ